MIRTVSLRVLGGYVSRIPKERHKAAVRAVRQTMRERGRVIVREEINVTKPRIPFDRGDYTRSWQAVPIDDGCRIFSTCPYASVIDRGRRPGFGVGKAGIQALMGWAHRHGMDVEAVSPREQLIRKRMLKTAAAMGALAMAKAGIKARKAKQAEDVARVVAFAIAAAIKRRGLPAKLVFDRASKRIVEACRYAAKLAIAGAEFNGSHG